MSTKRTGKDLVIQLPASDTLQAARLDQSGLESLVLSILGAQTGRGIDHVILKGGAASGPASAPAGYEKTIWSRDC